MKKFASSIAMSLIALVTLSAQAQTPAKEVSYPTRFGKLVANAESSQILTLNGKIFSDEPVVDDPKSLIKKFELDDSDVLVFNMDNGPNCPAQFFIVRVSKKGATSTPSRGDCGANRVNPVLDGKTIKFDAFRFDGKKTIVVTYKNGQLRENGKVVPNN